MHKERRGKRRKTAARPLRYCCSDPEKKSSTSGRLPDSGIIINESPTGMCFIATCPIEVGRALVINCPWLSKKTESGTVRWCKQAAFDLWRVGFQKSH
jgi:hypothetical protein